MNILLINHYAGSPDMGMEFRPYYFAREWVKMGHKVDIIAADYSHLRRKNPEVEKDFQSEVIDGINYHWIKTNKYEGNGAKRAITMAKFVSKLWLNAKKIIREMEPDVVICSSTYPLDTFVGQRIRRKSSKKVKLIHEVHDMWPATLIELGGMSRYNPFVIAMQIGENSAYRNSDFVIALLEYSEPYMKQHGLKEGKFKCIPLGIDMKEWQNTKKLSLQHEEALRLLKLQNKFIVGYFGGHAMSNALDVLVDAADICQRENEDVQFVLVGDGVEKADLIKKAEKLKLNNITFLPPIDKKEIPELVELFDCIYIGTYKSDLYRFGLCLNKMLDSMMSAKPLVCSITSPPTWAEQCECGITVEAENPVKISKAIMEIFNMTPENRKTIGKRGRTYAKEHFDIDKLAKEVIYIADSI